MRGWIDNCQRSHELCKMKPREVGGPKRLLQCLSDGSVRLVETKSCTQRCDYIALSYCWGDGKAVKKTMKKTLDRHQLGIPNEDLPPLFQEVAAVAHGLDTYLWIDSLCIIQDSKEDKDKEVMQMSDIFRGALVVVVAATAESPLDSLLRVKPQSGQSNTWRTASPIRYREMDLNFQFRKRTGKPHSFTRDGDATRDTPIAKRAWCFQEKLLASRCLVFCEDEVVWECRSCCLCECGGKQEHFKDAWIWMLPYERKLLPLAEHEPLQLDGTLKYFADAEAAYSFWKKAVFDYSRRALTFKTDRLPAISAVASTVAGATGDCYLAGLWRSELLFGLSWRSYNFPEDGPTPSQEYIVPTWSWASYPGGVSPGFPRFLARELHDDDNHATVLEAWTVLKGPDLYGAVSDGAIVLSGVHCDVEMKIQENSSVQFDFGNGEVECWWWSSYCMDMMLVERDTDVDWLGGNPRYLRRVTPWQTTGRQPDCSGTVHLLWLWRPICLILTPSRRKEGSYERLGIFNHCHTLEIPETVQPSRIELV